MSLKDKINLLVSLNLFFVLAMVISAVSYLVVDSAFREAGERALMVARTVAALPQLVRAFREPEPSLNIQPLAESIRRSTGAAVHRGQQPGADPLQPSQPCRNRQAHGGGGQRRGAAGARRASPRSTGTLGYSVRGKAPVFDANRRQIGVVSVGFLVHNVQLTVHTILLKLSASLR